MKKVEQLPLLTEQWGMSDLETSNQRLGYFQRFSLAIIGSLERFFYNWGYNVAVHPWKFIVICLAVTAVCGLGLITFTPENRPDKLWIPWNSEFVRDSDWLREHFPSPIRFHYAIIAADNILQPRVLHLLHSIHKDVREISSDGTTWSDLCFKLPVTKFGRKRRKRRQTSASNRSDDPFANFDDFFEEIEEDTSAGGIFSGFDPSISLSAEAYCSILSNFEEECWESNLIELWNFDSKVIGDLTQQQIIDKINSPTISPVFGRPVNYTTEMGGIIRNETGQIVKASAIFIRWFAKINQTALRQEGQATNDLGTGELVDRKNLEWEKHLSNVLLKKSQSLDSDIVMYFSTARSFGDISGATIMNDAGMLAVGFTIVFIYVVFMLGKFNLVEQRPLLSLAGLSCVGLAIIVSYGICSAFRGIYGPVHNILPFLLLGIGIDDMFVIMQCWNNLSPSESKRPLPERMGLTLKHAGVSITVTSVTDFVAFAIGASTVLPALQSFCLYAALGIVATYIFQATFFVAWFTLDQKRIESHRNAFFIWIKHSDYKPNKCSEVSFAQIFFENIYSKWMFKTPVKVLVFVITGILLGLNIWGNFELRQEFNPIWFLPQDSYLFQFYSAKDRYFPGRALKSSQSLFEVDSWYEDFKIYSNTNFDTRIPHSGISVEDFDRYLGKFLFSPSGSKYRAKFKFNGNLTCGASAPPIVLTTIGFKFKSFEGPEEHLPAMREIKEIVKYANFTETENSRTFVWSFAFAGWETDEIITVELYRNMILAMVCVLITTMLLIANLPTCLMVLTCVIFTLVDVGGSMHFWNLTIDTVSCIDLVLAIGLCVDYSAHIGHSFMTVIGTRNERSKQALIKIGPAVLNGGFSTFLAFVLLANSRSHVFMTFFKIFFLVVVFGLFHGLVFLPTLLSIIGPQPYPSAFTLAHSPEVSRELTPAKTFIRAKNGGEQNSNGLPKSSRGSESI
ncbi:unnamed protein product [Allacma fusca]|uniref:SSD domain-containing protein n=1 Tax=Allacma fusca TaxID=39272 RepID=A0A8J2JW60_9HEXA|nr:unnamed protein product [Allacma fusca]